MSKNEITKEDALDILMNARRYLQKVFDTKYSRMIYNDTNELFDEYDLCDLDLAIEKIKKELKNDKPRCSLCGREKHEEEKTEQKNS